MSSPPLADLDKLSERLVDVSWVLHEMAHDNGPDVRQRIVRRARKARLGTAVRTVARHCRLLAAERFDNRLRGGLENALSERGWSARCVSRPINECDSGYWPPRQVAVLVEIEDLETRWAAFAEEVVSVGIQHLKNDWPFVTVPVMNEKLLAPLALRPSSHMPLPDSDFVRNWSDCIDKPIFSSSLGESFDAALLACMHVSAIIASRGVQDFHPEEHEILSKVVDSFKKNHEIVANAYDLTESEHSAFALNYLDRSWNRVVDELEDGKAGRPGKNPLCMTHQLAIAGKECEHAVELAATRLLMLQSECSNAPGWPTTTRMAG